MSHSLVRWSLLFIFVCGCATANHQRFTPASVNDPGPWPLESHQSGLYKHWLSVGRYRTSDLGVLSPSFRTDKQLIQVASYSDIRISSQYTVDDANGRSVLIQAGGKPCDKNLQLGSWKIPISNDGSILGRLSRDGQTISDFECRLSGSDMGQLHVGSKTIVLNFRESKKELLDHVLGSPERTLDFVLDGEPVGTLHLIPERRVWLKRELDEDSRVTIVATIVTLCEGWDVESRNAAANNASMSRARL